MANIDDEIAAILDAIESGAMLNKYILIIEGIDPEGQRALYSLTNDDAKSWDNIGLLTFALRREESTITRNE